MKYLFSFSLILTALTLDSCRLFTLALPAPDQFKFNRELRTATFIVGQNYSDIDSVTQTGDNALLMRSGVTVALAADKMTNFVSDMTVVLLRGEGLKLHFRTTSENFPTDKGIAFVYTKNGSWLEENNAIIARFDSIRALANDSERVIITNLGQKYTIQVGCRTIYRGSTLLNATEYIIPVTLPDTRVLLTGIDFISVRNADPRNTPKKREERIRW